MYIIPGWPQDLELTPLLHLRLIYNYEVETDSFYFAHQPDSGRIETLHHNWSVFTVTGRLTLFLDRIPQE